MSNSKPHENPLVPNNKLRQIYAMMSEARALDEFAVRAAAKARAQFKSTRGQEACRASTAIALGEDDLVSDAHDGIVMDLIAGRSASFLLRRLAAIVSGEKNRRARHARAGAALLPWTKDTPARLMLALGAAASVKASGRVGLVMAYVYGRDLTDSEWRRVLRLAAELELPIIFVVLPAATSGRSLYTMAQACGVPGFPVDAADAVAIYRVAQESIGRARGDGGPVLIECLAHRLSGAKNGQDDPLALMRGFMLGRTVASKAWLNSAGRAFRSQLQTGPRTSRSRIQR